MKKTAVSVRRNIAKKLTLTDLDADDDHSKTTTVSLSVPPLLQDNGLDQFPDGDGDDDDDDVFSDALDTLSLKHSMSNGVVAEAMTPPTPPQQQRRSFDTQPRDFMLNRFLPAAKSLTVEQQQPQYASKRQQPVRHIRDIVPAADEYYRATPKRYEYVTVTTPSRGIYDEETDEDDESDEGEYLSKRGCGMMSPQVCFKNSLGVLSSVNGLKEKPYSHDHVKSSKVSQLKSRFQSVKKLALDYKQKLGSRPQSPVHSSFAKNGSEQLETSIRPLSPYRQTGCMSPYRSVGNVSPLHPAGFPGTRKEAEIMRANRLNKHIRNNNKPQELLYPKSTRLDCSTSSDMVKKTLHVDPKNCPKTSNDKGIPEMAVNKPKPISELRDVNVDIKKMEADQSGCELSSLAPPPPKKPSESWLFRNFPSVSSKIPSGRYLFHPQKKNLEENFTSVTKWETIVKTSCMHNDHIRYSEELVARSSKV